MSKKHIILDIGHAHGTGARGNGMEEHARCAEIAQHLAEDLRALGHAVTVLDHPQLGNGADLAATARDANAIPNASFGISLHMDAAETPEPCGAHVCYLSNTGRRIAQAIAAPLCTLLPGRAESIVKRSDLYILKHTRAPWVLVECGFITNPTDAATDPAAIAYMITRGINKYFGNDK